MSPRAAARAEIAKLARLVGEPPERFGYLAAVPPADLRALREQATDALFDAHRDALGKAAAASRVLPAAVSAAVGQRAFGPLLCARIAGLLEAERAVDIARRMPDPFLAEVAAELDPRRVSEILSHIPDEQIVRLAQLLVERGEHVAMGRFVGHLSPAALRGVVEVVADADLVHIAFLADEREPLAAIVAELPRRRLLGMLRAAGRAGIRDEAVALLAELGMGAVPR